MFCMKSTWLILEVKNRTGTRHFSSQPPETVDDAEPLARVHVIHCVHVVGKEGLLIQLDVDLVPPYVVGGHLFEHGPTHLEELAK